MSDSKVRARRHDRARHQRRRSLGRQAHRWWRAEGSDPSQRHPALGAGDAESESRSCFDEVVCRGQRIRTIGGAAIVRGLHGDESRRGAGDPGRDPRAAHDLRRGRVVVLRPAHRAGRFDQPRSHALRLQGGRHEVSRAPPCSRVATRPTSTSAGRWCASSVRPPCATSPRTRARRASSRIACASSGRSRRSKRSRSRRWTTARASSTLGHEKRLFVKVGEKLATRPIGPHSIATFTTEWRSYLMTVWGPRSGTEAALEDSTLRGGLAAGDVARRRGREGRPEQR